MSVTQMLTSRNDDYASDGFTPGLRMMPSLKTIVIGCVDPRVDPEELLGLTTGEVAVIRNVGGRVTPDVLDQLAVLRAVTQAAGADLGAGWELVVLQHTDCGITRVQDRPELLAPFLGVAADDDGALEAKAVGDPWAAVAGDVAALRAETRLGEGIVVAGLVYDVTTGRVTPVE